MANTDLKKLMEKREALRQEIEKIDNFVELYRELFGTETLRLESPREKAPVEDAVVRRKRKGKSGSVTSADLAPQMREIMIELGKPLKRSQLLSAIEDRGLRLAGSDPGKYLGTILWRMREAFVNIDGYGYWPRDIPNIEAGYTPDVPAVVLALPGGRRFEDDI